MEQQVEHGAIGIAPGAVLAVAIEAILADIEIEGREILVAEIDQQPGVGVEIIGQRRGAQFAVEFGEQRQHIAFEFGNLARIAHIADKTVERAEQVAEGVPELAILVGDAFEDFVADAVVFGVIDAQRP